MKLIYILLLLITLSSCGHYGPKKHEKGVVIEKQYFPDTRQTVSGVGYSSGGHMVLTSHSVGKEEQYTVIFKCEHGVVFSVNRSDIYGILEKGDKVNIDYSEYLNKDESEILDLKFIDAQKL